MQYFRTMTLAVMRRRFKGSPLANLCGLGEREVRYVQYFGTMTLAKPQRAQRTDDSLLRCFS